jgi:TRAP transporter 4TM/12TM fusion protein
MAFAHSGMSVGRFLSTLFLTMDGIFSAPTAASANFIFIYVLFGSFLLKSGAGEFFIDFAKAIAGAAVGGPAKIAVIASSLFGTVSGSPTANVVTTGTFTIPLMKKIGYSPYFAGAVESIASTGGAIMPPVMHAAAFLMVEITGIPYLVIITAAVFPALLFYFGLFLMVHLRAISGGLQAMSKSQLPSLTHVMRRGWQFALPLVALVVLLALGYTIVRAAFMAIIGTLMVSWFRSDTRMGISEIADALIDGAKSTIVIMASCATAGIVVGVIGATGVGGKFTSLVVSIGSGSIFLSLLLTMVACTILGMGLPTPVAYLLTAVLAGPALTMMGVPLLAAHLFILYYASLSTITPPVAVAAYAAAGIAGDSPMKVGFTAVRLGSLAFIIPFMFIYQPALLLSGSFAEIVIAIPTSVVGVVAFAVGLEGWLIVKIGVVSRFFLILSGLMLIYPGLITDTVGMTLLVGNLVLIWQKGGKPELSTVWVIFCRGNYSYSEQAQPF